MAHSAANASAGCQKKRPTPNALDSLEMAIEHNNPKTAARKKGGKYIPANKYSDGIILNIPAG
jgi:hypothetical protein